MSSMRRVLHGIRRAGASDLLRGVATNSTARVLAIVGLTLATVVVARVGERLPWAATRCCGCCRDWSA